MANGVTDKPKIRRREDQPVELNNLLDEYADLLNGTLGCALNYKHHIKMTDKSPFHAKMYPIARKYTDEAREIVEDMEDRGVIAKAQTQYVSPLLPVVKPNGKLRVCVDAREVDLRMENDHTQPPSFDQVVARIERNQVFSKLESQSRTCDTCSYYLYTKLFTIFTFDYAEKLISKIFTAIYKLILFFYCDIDI